MGFIWHLEGYRVNTYQSEKCC